MSSGDTPKRRTSARNAGPVEVRSMSSPKPGWSLQEAVDLLDSGYSPEQVEHLTGFDARHVAAQQMRRRKEERNPPDQVRPMTG
jgi:hypothetical protein